MLPGTPGDAVVTGTLRLGIDDSTSVVHVPEGATVVVSLHNKQIACGPPALTLLGQKTSRIHGYVYNV